MVLFYSDILYWLKERNVREKDETVLSMGLEDSGSSEYFEENKWTNFDYLIRATGFIMVRFHKTLSVFRFSLCKFVG